MSNNSVQEIREAIRIAESNGDNKTVAELKKKLQHMTING